MSLIYGRVFVIHSTEWLFGLLVPETKEGSEEGSRTPRGQLIYLVVPQTQCPPQIKI